LYVEALVPEYWIVDDEARAVTVVRPGLADAVVTDVLRWTPRGTDETLEIMLGALFA
jgi:Uma2 family endonuclease